MKPLEKPAETSVPIADFIANRWSPRVFDSSHKLSDGDLTALGEAARWAPSSNNAQPWKLALLRRGEAEFEAVSSSGLTGFNQSWAPSASGYVVVIADQLKPDGSAWDKAIAYYNAGLASAQIVFQAEHMGLRAHYMGGIVHDEIAKVLNLDLSKHWIVNVIAVGLQKEHSGASEELQARETARRERKPLSEIVIHGLV